MRRKAVIVGIVGIFFLFLSIATRAILTKPAWPSEIAWPAERLTRMEAEELSDALITLVNELLSDKDKNGGGDAARIIDVWQKAPIVERHKNMFHFVTFVGNGGVISSRFLYGLTDLAFNIDDLSEHGDITISGAVKDRYLVVTIKSLSVDHIRRIIIIHP